MDHRKIRLLLISRQMRALLQKVDEGLDLADAFGGSDRSLLTRESVVSDDIVVSFVRSAS